MAGLRKIGLICCVALMVAACGKPAPRAPDTIQPQVEKSPRPTLLEEMSFSPEQDDEIDALLEHLYAGFEGYDETRLVLLDEVIVEIEAGKLDREKLTPLAEAAVSEFERSYPLLLDTTNDLHAILTPQQREEFVRLLSGEQDEALTAEEKEAAREERLGRLLDLTTGQKAKLYPSLGALALKNWGLMSHVRGGIAEAKEAFVQDQFDAHELALGQDLRLMEIAEVFYQALEVAMEVLTGEQRKTLVALLNARYR